MIVMTKLTENSCTGFAALLASKASVPGGGGAAALAGALGAALCSMVGNFTVGKKKYAAVEEDVKAMLVKLTELRTRLLELVDLDAEAFEPLSRAYAIPKDDPRRAEVLEKASLDACSAPIETAKCCAGVVELLEEMFQKGSVMLISDVGCGALLCRAAMEAAAMNVFINTKTLRNRDTAAGIEREVDALLNEYLPRAERIAEDVTARIRGHK